MERLPSHRHLDDEAFLAALSAEPSCQAQEHLAQCADCRLALDRFRLALLTHREAVDFALETAEPRLAAQRTAVRTRWNAERERQRRTRLLTWTTAAGAALLALGIGTGLWRIEREPRGGDSGAVPTATATVASARNPAGSDADLLRRAEVAVEGRTPAALAPVEALLDELGAPARREGGV